MNYSNAPNIIGALLAISRKCEADKTITKNILQWCFGCTYTRPQGRRKDLLRGVRRLVARVRRKTGFKIAAFESTLASVSTCMQRLVDLVNQWKYPLNSIQMNSEYVAHMNIILEYCHLHRPVPFWWAIPFWQQAYAVKIAEGSYGEVYSTYDANGDPRILKFMAIHSGSDHHEINLEQIIPDVACSKHLSDLNDGELYHCRNFPRLYHMYLIYGVFPATLINAWWKYSIGPHSSATSHPCPKPNRYDNEQLFVVLELEHCGKDTVFYSKVLSNDPVACVTIVCQAVTALAVAEGAYCFEHRDLHVGNILLKPTEENSLDYIINGKRFTIDTCGYHVYIIDYTMSRITVKNRTFFMPASSYENEIGGEFDWADHKHVYAIQSSLYGEIWESHQPKTNLLWVRYLIENLQSYLDQRIHDVEESEENYYRLAIDLLHELRSMVLRYQSAREMFLEEVIRFIPFISLLKRSR